MFRKVHARLEEISFAAKLCILIACAGASLLMLAALLLTFRGDLPLHFLYLRHKMGQTAVKMFAEGIFLGLSGEFLLSIIDRNRK